MNNSGIFSNGYVILMFAVIATVVLGWLTYSAQLVSLGMSMTLYSLAVVEWTYHFSYPSQKFIEFAFNGFSAEVADQIRRNIYRSDPRYVGYTELLLYIEFVGMLVRVVIFPFVVAMIVSIYRSQKAKRQKSKYSIKDLMYKMAEFKPHLKPLLQQDLLALDPDEGSLAREKSPIRLAIMEGLIRVYDLDWQNKNDYSKLLIPTFDKTKKGLENYLVLEDDLAKSISKIHDRCWFDREAATAHFTKMLGARFTNSQNMNIPRKALYAVFVTYMQGESSGGKKIAFQLIEQFNHSFDAKRITSGKFVDMSGVDDVIAQYENTDIVKKVKSQHFYELTLMSGLLDSARSMGKIWCDLWWWIKHVDRQLWFATNQAGSLTAWSETSAIRGHMLAEKELKHGIEKPFVKTAVEALYEYLDDTEGWIPAIKPADARGLHLGKMERSNVSTRS